MRAAVMTLPAIFLSPGLAAAQPAGDWGPYGPWGPWHMWGWMGGGMFLFVLIFGVVVIVAGVVVVRWLFATPPGRLPASGETAEDILKKRYARGEIQKEEYEAKLRDLRN